MSHHLDISNVIQLDLTVEDEGEDRIFDGAVKVMNSVRPEWNSADIVCKSYNDGITNKLVGCRHKDDTLLADSILVRLYGQKTEKIIDRDVEKVVMFILHEAKCAKALHCQFANGIAYGFVPGACLTPQTVREHHIGRLVAEEMVKLGAIDPLQYKSFMSHRALEVINKLGERKPCTFTKLRKFLDSAPESFPDEKRNEKLRSVIPPLSVLEGEATELETHLSALGSPLVFSHNDILLNNIVYNKNDERCYFIDYEYAGFNYQAFDIANHFCEWAGIDEVDYSRYPDKETQLRWLTHYLFTYKAQQGASDPTPSDDELLVLYIQVNKFSLAAHLFWGVWALVQARYSAIDFDFLEYGKIRLDQYFKRKSEFMALELPQ